MAENQNQKKRNRTVKFEDVLAMYKFTKDCYAKLDEIERRLVLVEEYIIAVKKETQKV